MAAEENYLKKELYELIQKGPSIFEFLQEGSLDGIWYWDLEKKENEWMSPQFWETFGFDPNEKKHLTKEWQDLINQDDLKMVINNFNKHCEDPRNKYDQVVRYRHKDGSTVWVRCRGLAIRDENGKPIRMLGAHTNLTSLKKIEEKLKGKITELEQTNKLMIDREIAMVKLKEEVNQLCKELGKPPKYSERF